MKTLGHVFGIIQDTVKKERRGFFKKAQYERAIMLGIFNLFDKHIKIYEQSRAVMPALIPFMKTATINITNGEGVIPTDFAKEQTLTIAGVDSYPADFFSRDSFEERKNSVLMPPTQIDPIVTLVGTKLIIYPQNASSVLFTYFAKPSEIVLGVTLDGDNRGYTYNEGTSTHTEFGIEFAPDIAKEALAYLSVQSQDQASAQLADNVKI